MPRRPGYARLLVRAALVATTVSALLFALSPAAAAGPSPELTYVPEVDLPVTVVGGAAWVATELAKRGLAPDACRWCAVGPLDTSVRDALLWSGNPGAAHQVSNVTVLAVAPASALGLTALAAWQDGRTENIAADLVIVTQAMVLAMDLNQLTKYIVGRQRPYAHFENADVLHCEGASTTTISPSSRATPPRPSPSPRRAAPWRRCAATARRRGSGPRGWRSPRSPDTCASPPIAITSPTC